MLKDIASLPVMKPRCEELGKREVLFLLILASVGRSHVVRACFRLDRDGMFVI